MTPLYPPKSWDSRWRPEYGRECRFSGSTIKMLDLGDDHPVRKLLHAAWCAAIPWHLWIGVSTIPRAKNLLCRSVSGINHHYEPGPMNPPLWPSTSKLFLFHDSPPPDEIKDWETPSTKRKTQKKESPNCIFNSSPNLKSHFVFATSWRWRRVRRVVVGKTIIWYGMDDGVNGFCFPMPLPLMNVMMRLALWRFAVKWRLLL